MEEKAIRLMAEGEQKMSALEEAVIHLRAELERVKAERDALKEKERKVQIEKNALVVVLRKCADALTAALKGE